MKTSSIVNDIRLMDVYSPAFSHCSNIPKKYTCDGENINPPLIVRRIPKDTKSLVLFMDDTNSANRCRTHWLVWNIDPHTEIAEHSVPGVQGRTDFRLRRYVGPCQSNGAHLFHFRIFALSNLLRLDPRSGKQGLEKAMAPYILSFGYITGYYGRK